jgi:hypothetical protein
MLAALQFANPLYSAAPTPPFSALKLSFRSTVWRRPARRRSQGDGEEGSKAHEHGISE